VLEELEEIVLFYDENTIGLKFRRGSNCDLELEFHLSLWFSGSRSLAIRAGGLKYSWGLWPYVDVPSVVVLGVLMCHWYSCSGCCCFSSSQC